MSLPNANWPSRRVSTVDIRFTVLQSAEVGWSTVPRYPYQVSHGSVNWSESYQMAQTHGYLSIYLSIYLSTALQSFCWTLVAFSVS
jgi:hypothetical protein